MKEISFDHNSFVLVQYGRVFERLLFNFPSHPAPGIVQRKKKRKNHEKRQTKNEFQRTNQQEANDIMTFGLRFYHRQKTFDFFLEEK